MLTVDYLLGDNRNRYFGRGHKRTTYEVKLKNILEGVGSLHQEGLWSSKQSEIIQQPPEYIRWNSISSFIWK